MRPELETRLPDAHFTGYLHGKDLAEWYASSDLFVFPSTTETFGNVILEAFASSTPAVSVNTGGVADIINDGVDGKIALSNNPEDFADKIEFFLKNKNYISEFGSAARETAEQYSWKRINLGLLKSYETLLM